MTVIHIQMKRSYLLYAILAASISCSCTDKSDEPGGGLQPESGVYRLSGKVEKGPFVRGSSISVQPLKASLDATGTIFSGEIEDDTGSFNLGEVQLESQFVKITAEGYYFNEVTGNLSAGTLRLTAFADLSDRSSVNLNILTHLKSARIQRLTAGGKTFKEADKQAQKELLTQFGLQAYGEIPAESMTVAAGTEGSGVLIAISSILLSGRSDAQVTEFLSTLGNDFADDGKLTENNRILILQGKNRVTADLEKLSRNIVDRYNDLGVSITVPDLRYFYDWNNDGIAGNEIVDNVEVSLSRDRVAFDKTAAQPPSTSLPIYPCRSSGSRMPTATERRTCSLRLRVSQRTPT